MTTLVLSFRAINRTVKSLSLPILNWRVVYGILAVALVVLLVLYVILINGLTRGTYLIKSYSKEANTLMTQNKELQERFAESGFLGNVQNRVRDLSFEKTAEIKYIQILANSLGMVK